MGYGLVYPMEAAGVFAMSECELPCWMGLEVGVTDYDEALMVAETFEDLDLEIYPRFTVKDDLEGLMFFLSGTISSFQLNYTGCPLSVIIELGVPDQILHQDGDLSIVYAEGVGFHVYDGLPLTEIALRSRDEAVSIEHMIETTRGGTVSIYDSHVRQVLLDCD
ncbi:MAG: hypothetical protein AAFR22_04110 [Chloroflexota bacterium]